ncbi:hypothetical protein, partial [Thiolapillus sp.]|uniref:hypothetical protein n=1 Tax=Thiolapillus sp. TaxID=2017437 RepID=UPI003AF94E9F
MTRVDEACVANHSAGAISPGVGMVSPGRSMSAPCPVATLTPSLQGCTSCPAKRVFGLVIDFGTSQSPKIDSAFDNLLVPQPSWSPSTTQQLRKLVAAPYLAPNDWTPRLDA